jgi:oligoribonuclease (3'-5' exoribonuclease)
MNAPVKSRLRRATESELHKLAKRRDAASLRRVKLRTATEAKLQAIADKLKPLIEQQSKLLRHLEDLQKDTAETQALAARVSAIGATPEAYGFRSILEVLDIVAPSNVVEPSNPEE